MKILDFGIAKLADGVSGELTQDGTIFGTPWYMSPEQARGQASKVGPSIDLWALGLIAFRLLTGRNYWTAEGMAALIGQIVYDPMPPPSQMAPHLGPRFDEWFARACNREVELRFTSAGEEVKALAEALGVSAGPQHTGQLDASQFPAHPGYGAAPGISAAGMSMPGISQAGLSQPSMSQSGGRFGQSAGGMSQAGGLSQAGGGLSQSGGPLAQSGGGLAQAGMSQSGGLAQAGLSQSGGGLSQSGAPLSQSAGLSSTGAPLSQSGSTSAPFSATNAPVAAKPSNMASIAMGVLIAVLVAGGATAGWVILGHKKSPPAPVTATTAAPTTEATAAPTAAPSAAPTATAVAEAPAPTATAEATAEPAASAAAVPAAIPSASAAAAISSAAAVAGAGKTPSPRRRPHRKHPAQPRARSSLPRTRRRWIRLNSDDRPPLRITTSGHAPRGPRSRCHARPRRARVRAVAGRDQDRAADGRRGLHRLQSR